MSDQIRIEENRDAAAHPEPLREWDLDRDYYWRVIYATRPYVRGGTAFDFYEPGYRFGYESASRYSGKTWDAVESDLERDWDNCRYRSNSQWHAVKEAVRDAWDRVRSMA
jgi:hypothetical protein